MVALAHGKVNSGPLGRTILFKKEGGGKTDIPVLKAVRYSGATHHDICRPPKSPVGRPDTISQDAEAFILGVIGTSSEPVPWSEVLEKANAAEVASARPLTMCARNWLKRRRFCSSAKVKRRNGQRGRNGGLKTSRGRFQATLATQQFLLRLRVARGRHICRNSDRSKNCCVAVFASIDDTALSDHYRHRPVRTARILIFACAGDICPHPSYANRALLP